MPAAIICQELTRHYGAVHALDDLTLEVPQGSVFGFLGRNGAGKTTTIRLLTGLARPTRGRAWVAGIETTTADSAARRTFGYLPQTPAFYTWMTPQEYLDYAARLFSLSPAQARKRITEVLVQVGLEKAARRKIGGFSGGMLQRLGIAQALVHQPPVLLLDEPTSALDPAGRYEVLELIRQLAGEITVFLSSHILADIERVCDQVAILREGKLVLVAGRDELLGRYAPDAVEIRLPVGSSFPSGFLRNLRAQPWVAGAEVGSSQGNGTANLLHLTVQDAASARQALLPLLASQLPEVEGFAWVRPTLEEIFLQLSQ